MRAACGAGLSTFTDQDSADEVGAAKGVSDDVDDAASDVESVRTRSATEGRRAGTGVGSGVAVTVLGAVMCVTERGVVASFTNCSHSDVEPVS